MKDLNPAMIDALLTWEPPSLELGALEWWLIIANLQLALRHPKNRGPAADRARLLCDGLIKGLPNEPMREFARRGYDATQDEEPTAA